MRPAG
jgi:hypothetical protein